MDVYTSKVKSYLCNCLSSDLDEPTFNTSSQKNISVIEGRYVSIVCNATSNPNAEYRWTNSSGHVMSTTRTLVFQTIKRSDTEAYTCIANNSAGLETKSSLMIDVQCESNCYLLFAIPMSLSEFKSGMYSC